MLSRLSLLLAFFVVAAPAHAALQIQHWTAPSGARVYFVEARNIPMLDARVDFDAGSARDPSGKSGLSALTHALLDAGAAGMDENTIADRLADVGAVLGGGVDDDRASISLRVLSSATERDAALLLMQQIVSRPAFPAAVLEREKTRMIAGLREADTQPGSILARRFSALMYGRHPYGQTPTEASVRTFTQAELARFHREHYVAAAAVVTLVGDISRREAEDMAQRLTAGLPRGGLPAKLPAPALPEKSVQARIPHPASQAHVAIGLPALQRGDPDFFPLVVGNYVLGGGGFVSRLMKEVRDARGLSYGVYSYFQPQKVAGPFRIGLETKVAQADEAVKVVRDTLTGFLNEGPTASELQAAKDNLINGFALRLDSNAKILEQVATIGFYGLPLDYLATYPDRVRAVTAEQVKAAFARRVPADRLVTVIVGGS